MYLSVIYAKSREKKYRYICILVWEMVFVRLSLGNRNFKRFYQTIPYYAKMWKKGKMFVSHSNFELKLNPILTTVRRKISNEINLLMMVMIFLLKIITFCLRLLNSSYLTSPFVSLYAFYPSCYFTLRPNFPLKPDCVVFETIFNKIKFAK